MALVNRYITTTTGNRKLLKTTSNEKAFLSNQLCQKGFLGHRGQILRLPGILSDIRWTLWVNMWQALQAYHIEMEHKKWK